VEAKNLMHISLTKKALNFIEVYMRSRVPLARLPKFSNDLQGIPAGGLTYCGEAYE
jgi:hypothetical protein